VKDLREKLAGRGDAVDALLLLNELDALSQAVESDVLPPTLKARVEELSQGKGQGWSSLFVFEFDASVELLKNLRELDRRLLRERI
jgi:hypothetical protein